jgi:TPR repeat protein
MKETSLARVVVATLLAASAAASWAQTVMDGNMASMQGRTDDAIAIWTPLANRGDLPSQVKLGELYMTGKGSVAKNFAESVKWFRMAASQNDVNSQWNLGIVGADDVEKCAWLKIADANGHPDAKLIMPFGMSADDTAKCVAKSAELRSAMKR